MSVFCKHPTPVPIIRATRRDDALICACHQRASTAIVAENYRLSTEAVFSISHLNSGTLPGGDWKGHSLPWILCHFMWEWKYIIVSQLHYGATVNVQSCYIAFPVNLPAIWLLRDTGFSDHRLRLTGWADICIAYWWQRSLIPLAPPNYQRFFRQHGSQDCAFFFFFFFYKASLILLSPSPFNNPLKWMTYIWDAETRRKVQLFVHLLMGQPGNRQRRGCLLRSAG